MHFAHIFDAMNVLKRRKACFVKSAVVFLAGMVLVSCSWNKPISYTSPPRFSTWNLTRAQIDSLNAFLAHLRKLEAENRRYKSRVQNLTLELKKREAEADNLMQLNGYLKDELKNTKSDLDFVETQFISLENRIQSAETKASAVAAQAEARILLDKVLKNDPEKLDSLTLRTIRKKLASSDRCLKHDQFTAAAYYAKRGQRLIEIASKKRMISAMEGNARIVSARLANLRDGPGSNFKVIEQLKFGTVVFQIAEKGRWKRVRTWSGKEGWVHKALIK